MAGETVEPGSEPSPTANIDGGGNVASGNAEPEQCVGVVCATGDAPPLTPAGSLGAGDHDPQRAGQPDLVDGRRVRVHGRRRAGRHAADRLGVRVPHRPAARPGGGAGAPGAAGAAGLAARDPRAGRRRGLGRVRQPGATGRARPGHPPLRGAGARLGRQRRPDAGRPTTGRSTSRSSTRAPDPTPSPPDTRISATPSDSTSTSATFAFAGTDNATPGLSLSFECSLDGAPFTACTTPVDLHRTARWASHTFWVRAIDRATVPNADPTPATHTWEVLATPADTTPPETTVDSGPDPITVDTDATFTFSSDDPAATFECSLDGGATWAAVRLGRHVRRWPPDRSSSRSGPPTRPATPTCHRRRSTGRSASPPCPPPPSAAWS